MTLALLAIVLQAGMTSPVPHAGRSPVTSLSRSETPSTGARRLRVLVRIGSQAPIKGVRIADVMENVREIWRPYAEIDFVETANVVAETYDDELRLVIADGAPPPGSASVLGWIEFLDGRPRNTITVSPAAARTMMSRDTWLGRHLVTLPPSVQQRFVTRALSRSSAHEIGHYLLRSRAHATQGLMRAQMTVNEIMDDAPALCRLLPSEMASLDRRLAEASEPHNPLNPIILLRDRAS